MLLALKVYINVNVLLESREHQGIYTGKEWQRKEIVKIIVRAKRI